MKKEDQKPIFSQPGNHWVILVLVVVVLTLSALAFRSPIAQEPGETTPSPEVLPTDEIEIDADAVSIDAEDEEQQMTPEEIGYTDGIIFWSTILVLILLIGTLREIIHRRRN